MPETSRQRLLPVLTLVSASLLVFSCGNNGEPAAAPPAAAPPVRRVLHSPLAGRWYTADRDMLAREIRGYLDKVKQEPLADVIALMLPHAGYRFSGQTAAYGIEQVAGKPFKRVIIMGPSHQLAMRNLASVPDVTHYATPLGETPLDLDFIAELTKHPEFRNVPEAHLGEHSVQIELPLIQAVLTDFRLVPIVVGQLDLAGAERMAGILKELADPGTLVVASTDFTHYGPGYGYVPFRKDIPQNLEKLDMGAFEFIRNRDVAGFYGYIDQTGASICGRCPVAVLLAMLPQDPGVHLLKYETSGRVTGDFGNSVSYVAAAFTGQWQGRGVAPSGEEAAPPLAADLLSPEEKQQLLRLARRTLEHYMEKEERPAPEALGIQITPAMREVMGAFVTLTKQGQLRGCIGEIFPRRALYMAVRDHALNAALNDQRFPPVRKEELPELDLEISALSRPQRVASYKDIVIGKHGIVLQEWGRQAVYLPQVAPEQGWGLEETLSNLSTKAGLPRDAWQSGAAFLVFEAIVFGEHEK